MEKFKLNLNDKNISTVVEYCLEERKEFSAVPTGSDGWDVEVVIPTIKKAVKFGMFVKEHKLPLADEESATPNPAPAKASRTKKEKETAAAEADKKDNEDIFSLSLGQND